jgi:putative addiction module component (TIGR02574 family)
MISTTIEQSALSLPMHDRAHLVHLLLDSLDEPNDANIQQIWLKEAQKRANEIDSGKAELVTGDELNTQVQALFK